MGEYCYYENSKGVRCENECDIDETYCEKHTGIFKKLAKKEKSNIMDKGGN